MSGGFFLFNPIAVLLAFVPALGVAISGLITIATTLFVRPSARAIGQPA